LACVRCALGGRTVADEVPSRPRASGAVAAARVAGVLTSARLGSSPADCLARLLLPLPRLTLHSFLAPLPLPRLPRLPRPRLPLSRPPLPRLPLLLPRLPLSRLSFSRVQGAFCKVSHCVANPSVAGASSTSTTQFPLPFPVATPEVIYALQLLVIPAERSWWRSRLPSTCSHIALHERFRAKQLFGILWSWCCCEVGSPVPLVLMAPACGVACTAGFNGTRLAAAVARLGGGSPVPRGFTGTPLLARGSDLGRSTRGSLGAARCLARKSPAAAGLPAGAG